MLAIMQEVDMDFLSSSLFWLFFALIGILTFVSEFRHRFFLPLVALGYFATTVVVILAFVFMWWQGGVAIFVSVLIWMPIAMGIVRRL